MNKKRLLLLSIVLIPLFSACTYSGGISKTKTISRHYTLTNGHASLNADDYGETQYIVSIDEGIKTSNYCNFDSFYYYESETSKDKKYNKGFKDYISISEELTYFNFHYNGECECKITSNTDVILFEKKGTYSFVAEDDIIINYEDGTNSRALTRFGLNHNGIGNGKITYLQTPIEIKISDSDIMIYFWFYDSILHPSPWGEE